MQLEPSKLHQSLEKKNYNQYGASSLQAGRAGDWIDAAADIPQTAELQGGAAPSHSCLQTTVSPTSPVTPRGTDAKVFLASTQPQKGQDSQCCGWRKLKQKRDGGVVPSCQPVGQSHPGHTIFTVCCAVPTPPGPVHTLVAVQ